MARASATPAGPTLARRFRLTAASSTCAGVTRNCTPAASSSLRRNGLADASRRTAGATSAASRLPLLRRAATLVPVVQKPEDGGCGLLDRAARHVDHRPAVLGAQPARILDLVGDLPVVDIVAQVAVAQQVHAMAPDLGNALGAGDKTHDEGRVG